MSDSIVYIANVRFPTEKAHGVQIMKMCEAFGHTGAKVVLIVPNRKNPIQADPFDFYSVTNRTFEIKRLWCLDLTQFGWIGFWLEAISFAKRASFYALGKKDTFYTRDSIIALFLGIMRKKVVWEVHSKQTNLISRMALRTKPLLVVVTQGLKDFYTGMGVDPGRIKVAHDAVDQNLFREIPSKEVLYKELSLPSDRFVVSYVGKLSTMGQSKGVEDIVEPFITLQKKYPQAFLLLVGPSAVEEQNLELLMKEKMVSKDSYRIIPHVPYSEVPKYMRVSDALLMVYPNTEHYAHFMSPLKLFEYMASGVPIITSDLPSVREVLDDTEAYFFEADDKAAMTDTLLKVCADTEEGDRRARAALVEVGKYTWDKRAQEIMQYINHNDN